MELRQNLGFHSEQEELTGVVDHIIFAAGDGAFSVFRLRMEHAGKCTATVKGAAPLVGQEVHLVGTWVTHPRFGRQFQAMRMRISAPTSAGGIERFLASGTIDGVGPAMARRIVEKFGTEALLIIECAPSRLREVAGIGAKTAEKIAASYLRQSELRDIMLWLEDHGITGAYAGRIFKAYGSLAVEVMEKAPYRLAREIDGIGFVTADNIAIAAGWEKNSSERIAAGLSYEVTQISSSGHCCIPEGMLAERAAQRLGVARSEVMEVLSREVKMSRLYAVDDMGERLIYAPQLYKAEVETARLLRMLQQKADHIHVYDTMSLVTAWEEEHTVRLADAQREAVIAALEHGVLVLTGGPGTGKTTVVRSMIDILGAQGLEILLAAPTGRAAKRLAEATGCPAATVHRMLEAQGREDGEMRFGRDAETQLEADVIIVDEVSMMDIVLMQHLLTAVLPGTHLILVGDVDQLPAVGPGAVLQDILRSGVIPSVRLTEIFRQNNTGTIVLNAHAINSGRVPSFTEADFSFVPAVSSEDAAAQIVSICTRLLRAGTDLMDLQVLSPMRREACGVDLLNRSLQAALNPPAADKAEAVGFRRGDKVMQTRNDYTKNVFNGDIGRIVQIDSEHLTIAFAEDMEVSYTRDEFGALTLAYAMSVHKSQGSEYDIILLPLVRAHHIMLQRNLLYTAVTRAKKGVILIGDRTALFTAVSNDRTRRRYTLLAERLAEKI
ncbi:SF1B family DNA helicase RecD2 [Selenomonas dianae]|uniref:ATP-dependent RecD2 DNA helicase n=1 Tax=Selenomonas dianae TaxID=135079 RepID=A0ABP3CUD4_9FIRM|nr:ATP-dependent RecD-like DNA helicase [Selenomonas dianae]WLD81506.1 ATP-dependent RecD-like DNA helicase [Selenomonas dianae]